MQAVILAAGKSSRFYPFISLPHKSMIQLAGQTLLDQTLTSLEISGISEVLLVVAPGSPIPSLLSYKGPLKLRFIEQEKALGMGHALLQVKDMVEDKFLLLSAYHIDAHLYVNDLRELQKKSDVALLAKEDTLSDRYGVIRVAGDKVTELVEKPESGSETSLRVISMYALSKEFLSVLEGIPVEEYHFEKALDAYAKMGKVTYMLATKGVVTLKYSWDLLAMKDFYLKTLESYISPTAVVSPHAIIEGPVYVSDGVHIMEGACIKGPCWLGKNVVVGNNAIIRGGVIVEQDGVVGASMEVKNSVLMEGVTTHTGFIGDSVIGTRSRLAAGFCSANVRLDRKDVYARIRDEKVNTYHTHMGVICGERVDIGVHAITMPGVVIGNRVTIGPATVVMENIPDDTTIYTKFETVVKSSKSDSLK